MAKLSERKHGLRYYSSELDKTVVRVDQGHLYETASPREVLTTVLGSCISACIRDPRVGIGGMNHFLLPVGNNDDVKGADGATRYGDYAMTQLINALVSQGALRERLEIKLFGGADLAGFARPVGSRNVAFVLDYLETEGFAVAAQDLGGDKPRMLRYYPVSGKVQVKRLTNNSMARILFEEETKNAENLNVDQVGGTVELF